MAGGLNSYAVQEDIIAYARAQAPNVTIETGGVPEAEDVVMVDGVIVPYVVLRFSEPMPYQADASFGGPRYDGMYFTFDALCISQSDVYSRDLANYMKNILVGYKPVNGSAIRLDWGGGAPAYVIEGSKPQTIVSYVSFRTHTNIEDVGASGL